MVCNPLSEEDITPFTCYIFFKLVLNENFIELTCVRAVITLAMLPCAHLAGFTKCASTCGEAVTPNRYRRLTLIANNKLITDIRFVGPATASSRDPLRSDVRALLESLLATAAWPCRVLTSSVAVRPPSPFRELVNDGDHPGHRGRPLRTKRSQLRIAIRLLLLQLRKLNTMSAYTRQKVESKYRNRIRLERAPQKKSSDTHKTPYDRVKRCRELVKSTSYMRLYVYYLRLYRSQSHRVISRMPAATENNLLVIFVRNVQTTKGDMKLDLDPSWSSTVPGAR
ncbi:hypothetical protein PR048_001440 [Dryococelus australis]|uniref:Uncharacterized protein n=1 Tax=Dryococelus australis TaxID=614101 RepID=A0ABQ9IHD4_9NEOP|nr:hypothetical protein PR048_001440 [Dryococelus australis]